MLSKIAITSSPVLIQIVAIKAQVVIVELDNDMGEPVGFGIAHLVDTISKDSLKAIGDINGIHRFKNVKPGVYSIYLDPIANFPSPTPTLIKITDNDSVYSHFVSKYCNLDYPIKGCPIGEKSNKVIRVNYSLTSNYSFKSQRSFDVYSKKLQHEGYRSVRHDNQEVLIYINDEKKDQELMFSDACDGYLFCKKHKLIFK